MVREIGTRARPEIEQLLGRHVFLELRVKVKPRWRRDESLLERLGIRASASAESRERRPSTTKATT